MTVAWPRPEQLFDEPQCRPQQLRSGDTFSCLAMLVRRGSTISLEAPKSPRDGGRVADDELLRRHCRQVCRVPRSARAAEVVLRGKSLGTTASKHPTARVSKGRLRARSVPVS